MEVDAKKGGNGKGKQKANGKVTFCHRTGNGSFHTISVSPSARGAHLGHGDAECAPHLCRSYTGSCNQTPTAGVCDFTAVNEGGSCGNGQTCRNGTCV